MMIKLEDYFKYEDSPEREEMLKPPGGDIWYSKVTVTADSDQRIIPVPDGWSVAIQIGHHEPILLPDSRKYLKPRKEALEQGLSVSFIRQEGRIRCGVPYREISLADGYGFGFAAYFQLHLNDSRRFFDALADEERLRGYELVDRYIRNLIKNCIASDFRELSQSALVSGNFELDVQIRNSVNDVKKQNSLPSSLGFHVANVLIQNRKIAEIM